jgi:hypothetical protein
MNSNGLSFGGLNSEGDRGSELMAEAMVLETSRHSLHS